jgi:phage tail sheath protein FI
MSPTPNYPGVYIQEHSAPGPIYSAETSLTAFVGSARMGPVGIPVLISSFREYEEKFGTLAIAHPAAYAVRDYFANGGRQAWFLRLTGKGASKAHIHWPLDSDAGNALHFEARNAGAWGNEIRLQIQPVKRSNAALLRVTKKERQFHVSVYIGQSLAESFPSVNLIPGDPAFLPDLLERNSQLIRVSKASGNHALPDGLNLSEETQIQATDGLDGDALTASDYLGNKTEQTGIYALGKADLFNLLCVPPPQRGADTDPAVYRAALNLCVERRAMLLADGPGSWASNVIPDGFHTGSWIGTSGIETRNAAVYFPRLRQPDSLLNGREDVFVPCGAVAGVIAANDAQRGVWSAPAGTLAALNGVNALECNTTEAEWTVLNAAGVNSLRAGADGKILIWGARTLRGAAEFNDEYKYIPVRRTALHIEESVLRGIGWVSFERNDQQLWNALRSQVSNFMMLLYRAGAFQGNDPDSAFFVQCGPNTTAQQDIQNGLVHLIIGFAPLKPAEFIVIRISQRTAVN